jgi:hypothetical protein
MSKMLADRGEREGYEREHHDGHFKGEGHDSLYREFEAKKSCELNRYWVPGHFNRNGHWVHGEYHHRHWVAGYWNDHGHWVAGQCG